MQTPSTQWSGKVLALPLLVVIAVVVVYASLRHRPGGDVFAMGAGTSRHDDSGGLRPKLDEWVGAGLLRIEQAEAIEGYESASVRSPVSRMSLASEGIGYLGGALVVAAVMVQAGQRWDDLGTLARLLVLGLPTALVAAFGWPIGRRPQPAFQRLGSVLWCLGGAGIAGLAAELFVDVIHDGNPPDHGGALFVGAVTLGPMLAAWWWRREPLQELALFATTVATTVGVVDALGTIDTDRGTTAAGLALCALGVGWLTLGVLERIQPAALATVIGSLTILISPQIVRAGNEHIGLWLGLASAAALVALGATRGRVDVLLVGTAGLFQWVPQVALRYLGDQLGTTATLLLIGALLLALAASLSRLLPRLGPHRLRGADHPRA